MENINANASFDIISESIRNAKVNLRSQSFYYILWGWLAVVSSLFDFTLIKMGESYFHFIPWILMMPLGWLGSYIYSRNQSDSKGFVTQVESFLKYLWLTLGLAMAVVIFVSVLNKINPAILILALAGIGTLVSGLTMKFKPLIIGGILFFIFSLVCLYIKSETIYLVYALAIILGYLVPAYKLKSLKSNV
jgi:hypothetical protein